MPKDQKISTTKHGEGTSRVKPIKDIGNGVKTQLIKNPDKSTVTQRYKGGELVDSNYNPKKMRVKKTRKLKKTRIPKKLKKIDAPGYVSKPVTLDKKTQAISDSRDRKKNRTLIKKVSDKIKKVKLPKIKKGKKIRKTKNLITGKINRTRG